MTSTTLSATKAKFPETDGTLTIPKELLAADFAYTDTPDQAQRQADNTRRAVKGAQALQSHWDIDDAPDAEEPGPVDSSNTAKDYLHSLLTDLLHLSDALGIDFEQSLQNARHFYWQER